jgi:hypothetical protein
MLRTKAPVPTASLVAARGLRLPYTLRPARAPQPRVSWSRASVFYDDDADVWPTPRTAPSRPADRPRGVPRSRAINRPTVRACVKRTAGLTLPNFLYLKCPSAAGCHYCRIDSLRLSAGRSVLTSSVTTRRALVAERPVALPPETKERGAVVPFRSLTRPGAFGPEALAAMSKAFDAALKSLKDTGQCELALMREIIARRIIAAASFGQLAKSPISLTMLLAEGEIAAPVRGRLGRASP